MMIICIAYSVRQCFHSMNVMGRESTLLYLEWDIINGDIALITSSSRGGDVNAEAIITLQPYDPSNPIIPLWSCSIKHQLNAIATIDVNQQWTTMFSFHMVVQRHLAAGSRKHVRTF